jgi:hypothetical protein
MHRQIPLETAQKRKQLPQPISWWPAALFSTLLGGCNMAGYCAAAVNCRPISRADMSEQAAVCAANPCNPCAARQAGTATNPCAVARVSRPSDYQPATGNPCSLRARGEALFADTSLSSNGLACASCHNNGAGYMQSFLQDYPHSVAMARDFFGMQTTHLDEMIQICMVEPMASEPLAWDGTELAALSSYMFAVQAQLRENPCAIGAIENPCAACAPCSPANPCAVQRDH